MQETQGPKSSTRSFREGVWDPRSGEAGMVARPAAPVPQLQALSKNGTNNLTVIQWKMRHKQKELFYKLRSVQHRRNTEYNDS